MLVSATTDFTAATVHTLSAGSVSVDFANGEYFTLAKDAPPVAPTGLTASGITTTSVNLAWTDNSGNETGFKCELRAKNLVASPPARHLK